MSEDPMGDGPKTADPAAAVRKLVQQMAGRRLPGERELAASLNISRPRLRAVLAALQREGLVEPRHGSGTYAVDLSAQRLRQALVLIDANLKLADDPFFSMLVECLQANLQAEGIRCLIERLRPEDPLPPLEDGVLTLGLAGRAVIERQRPEDPPMVGLLLEPEVRPNRRASIVQLDDREAGATVASTLVELGYEHLVFFGRRNIPASNERWLGVEEVANRANVPLDFVSCHLNYADGIKSGREMPLPAAAGKVALIATNDWLAVGLQTGLHQRTAAAQDRSVERLAERFTVVSFDGLSLTDDLGLSIASLEVPIEVIARDAVAELQRLHQSRANLGRRLRYPLPWVRRPDSP